MESVMFISLDHNLSIQMKPRKTTEVGGQVVVDPERDIKFRGAYYETAEEDEIDFLRKHACFGSRIFEGVIPDDVVQVKQEVATYICGFPKCKFRSFTEEAMDEHRQEEHSKAARDRKRQEALDAEDAVPAKKKKSKGKAA